MAAARAKSTRRRGPLKGRSLVAIGLVAFIAVSSLVVWRRSVGVSTAKALRKAAQEKASLETERTTLRRDINDAQTRNKVIAEAQRRLGLHVAPDAQSRVLADPAKSP
jgi:hypothetical protein